MRSQHFVVDGDDGFDGGVFHKAAHDSLRKSSLFF
jgi:hypothetical protein